GMPGGEARRTPSCVGASPYWVRASPYWVRASPYWDSPMRSRPPVQERAQPGQGAFGVALDVAVDRATHPTQALRDPGGGDKVARLPLGEDREIAIPERGDVDGVGYVVETPGQHTLERDGEREERVGYAGVTPVEQQVATAANEDLAVVQVVVLEQFRQAERRELSAQVADHACGVAEALLRPNLIHQPLVRCGQRGQPAIWHPCVQQLVDVCGEIALNPGIEREHLVPPIEAPLALDQYP